MREKLVELRKKRNLTQKEVAERADIARSTYAQIETGATNPSYKTAIKIKEILKYKNDDIFLDTSVC